MSGEIHMQFTGNITGQGGSGQARVHLREQQSPDR